MFAVGELVRDKQPALAADMHAGKAGIPAGDDAMRADWKGNRGAVVEGRVKFLTVGRKPASVVDGIELVDWREVSCADLGVDVFQGVSRVDDAVGWRNVLRQRRSARSGSRVMHGRCRGGRLGSGDSGRCKGKEGKRCA